MTKQMKTSELAEFLGVYKETIWNYVKWGWCAPINPHAKAWVFDLETTLASIIYHSDSGKWVKNPLSKLTLEQASAVMRNVTKMVKGRA